MPPDDSYRLLGGQYATINNPFDLMRITRPERLRNMSVGDYMKQLSWNSPSAVRKIEKAWRTGKHYVYCAGPGQRKLYTRVINYNLSQTSLGGRSKVMNNIHNN